MPGLNWSNDRMTVRRLAVLLGVLLILSGMLPVLGASAVLGADTSFAGPTSTTTPNGWTNGANALNGSDDGVYATASGNNVDQGFRDFGFTVPAGSIVDGITAKANAFSSDSSGCQLSARLSWNGSSFSSYKTASLNGNSAAVLTFGSSSDTWGHIWDPTELTNANFRLQIRNVDSGSSCSGTTSLDWVTASVTYRTINSGTANPALDTTVCEAADFNFVIDMSGSIGVQGSTPSNLPDLKAGITGFVTAFQNAGGDGRYSGTRFNGSSTAALTSGYTTAATFNAAVNALSNPNGLTPTSAGIDAAAANNAHDRAGIPNVMFVVTDGSPNKPNTHGDNLNIPETWLQGANAAVASANAARAGNGAGQYTVEAVYLSTAGDPGDTSMPFSTAGRAQWATTVMDEIGGGTHLDSDFTGFVNDLFKAIGCAPPSLTISKVADSKTADAGDQIGFTMKVTNAGGSPAHDVVMDDNLPDTAGTDWSISPAVSGCSITGTPGSQAVHCAFGTLAAGAQKTVHVVTGTGSSCGVYDNTASFTSSDSGSGQASDSVNVRCASIAITKVADAPSVSAGDPIGFTITVNSNGPGAAKGVTLTDTLPTDAGTSWSVDGGTGAAKCPAPVAGVLSCDFGTMASGASYTVHLTSPTTKATVADSPVSNTAAVTTTNDGSAQASDHVDVLAGSIAITKVADAPSVSAGDPIGFTITVNSNGPGAAKGVTLTDTLPTDAGTSWSVDGGTGAAKCPAPVAGVLSCDFGTMASGASYTVHLTSPTTKATVADSPVSNTAAVTTTNDGSAQASDHVDVLAGSIAITKVADAPSVSAGDPIGFTITVNSNGPGAAKGVTLTDTLPTDAGTSWSVDGGTGAAKCPAPVAGVLSCDFGTMASGASYTVHLTSPTTKATVADSPVSNTAAVTTTNDGSAQASDHVDVLAPDLTVTKTADQSPITAGQTASFTMTVTNDGAGTARNVTLNDPLPGGVAWVLDDTTHCQIDSGVLSCSFGDLAPGASATVKVSGETARANCGTLSNTVTVAASNEPAAAAENDSASADLVVNCPAVGITKTADAPVVNAADQIGFMITLTNDGLGAATGLSITDTLPANAGLAWTIDPANADWAIGSGVLHYLPTSLAGSSSASVHIVSATTPATCGTVDNTAAFSSSNAGSGEDGSQVLVQCPDVRITKTADQSPILAGQTASYTITVWNAGDGTARNVTVNDPLPAGIAWTDNSGACTIADGILSCNFGDLAKDAQASVTVSGPTTVQDCGMLPNQATVAASNEPAAATENNTANASITVQCASISLVKTAGTAADGAQFVTQPGNVLFTYVVTNTGTASLTGIGLVDDNGTPADASDDVAVSCPSTTLAPQESMTCTASLSVGVGVRTNIATVTANPVLENEGQVSATDDAVVRVPQLTITKTITSGSAPVLEGDSIAYSLSYTLSNGSVTNGIITDVLPDGLTYTAGTATNSDEFTFGGYDAGTRTLTWTAATVTKDGSVAYAVTAAAGSADLDQPLTNVATITSDQTAPDSNAKSISVGKVEDITSPPSITPPPTSTLDQGPASETGNGLLVLLVAIIGFMLVAGVLIPTPERARRRNRRG